MFSPMMFVTALGALALFTSSNAWAQGRGTPTAPLPAGQTNEPFPQPIARTEGVITVTSANSRRCLISTASLRA